MKDQNEQSAKKKGWFIMPAYVGSFPDRDRVPACPGCKSTRFVAAMIDEESGISEFVCCENGHAWRPEELASIPVLEAAQSEEYASKGAGHALNLWINEFWTETKGSSDRAFAILSGAILDELLATMLEALAINNELLKNRLLSPNQPLGSFGPRIDACYLFGLISEREWRGLRIIQRIRNSFAHELANLSFADASMSDRVNSIIEALQMQNPREENGRKIFEIGVSALWSALMGKVNLISRSARMPFDPSSSMLFRYTASKNPKAEY